MSSIFNIFKRKPKTEEEKLFHEFKRTEKKTRALSNSIKSWKKSQVKLCNGQKKMEATVKKVSKVGVEPTLLIKQIELLSTIRFQMLNEVKLTTQDSLHRLHTLYNNMHSATKKRTQAKNEVDQLKKKVDKYYSQYPIPIEKYKNAVRMHKEAIAKHQQTHDNLLNDLRTINKGKSEFFKPCLEALLLAQLNCYKRIWKTVEPAIQEKEKNDGLSPLLHMEAIKALVSVSGPEKDVRKKLQTLKAKRSLLTLKRSTASTPTNPCQPNWDGQSGSAVIAVGASKLNNSRNSESAWDTMSPQTESNSLPSFDSNATSHTSGEHSNIYRPLASRRNSKSPAPLPTRNVIPPQPIRIGEIPQVERHSHAHIIDTSTASTIYVPEHHEEERSVAHETGSDTNQSTQPTHVSHTSSVPIQSRDTPIDLKVTKHEQPHCLLRTSETVATNCNPIEVDSRYQFLAARRSSKSRARPPTRIVNNEPECTRNAEPTQSSTSTTAIITSQYVTATSEQVTQPTRDTSPPLDPPKLPPKAPSSSTSNQLIRQDQGSAECHKRTKPAELTQSSTTAIITSQYVTATAEQVSQPIRDTSPPKLPPKAPSSSTSNQPIRRVAGSLKSSKPAPQPSGSGAVHNAQLGSSGVSKPSRQNSGTYANYSQLG